jgi:hypothetical protein
VRVTIGEDQVQADEAAVTEGSTSPNPTKYVLGMVGDEEHARPSARTCRRAGGAPAQRVAVAQALSVISRSIRVMPWAAKYGAFEEPRTGGALLVGEDLAVGQARAVVDE